MIRSMTAYASAEGPSARGRLVFELRSVNHRFLEIGFRLPEEFRALEPKLRERIEKRVSRGKIDVAMRFRAVPSADALSLNQTLVDNLRHLEQRLLVAFPESRSPSRMEVLAFPGVINEPEIDNAALSAEAMTLFDRALDDFIATRTREGERLKATLVERLDGIAAIVAQVRQWLPDIRAGLRQKFEARIAELKQPLDPGRLEQELVLARRLFARNGWPEIDVTKRSVEETAASIYQLLQERRHPELGALATRAGAEGAPAAS